MLQSPCPCTTCQGAVCVGHMRASSSWRVLALPDSAARPSSIPLLRCRLRASPAASPVSRTLAPQLASASSAGNLDVGALNASYFDPDAYLKRMLKETRLAELAAKQSDMAAEVGGLDSDMQVGWVLGGMTVLQGRLVQLAAATLCRAVVSRSAGTTAFARLLEPPADARLRELQQVHHRHRHHQADERQYGGHGQPHGAAQCAPRCGIPQGVCMGSTLMRRMLGFQLTGHCTLLDQTVSWPAATPSTASWSVDRRRLRS